MKKNSAGICGYDWKSCTFLVTPVLVVACEVTVCPDACKVFVPTSPRVVLEGPPIEIYLTMRKRGLEAMVTGIFEVLHR